MRIEVLDDGDLRAVIDSLQDHADGVELRRELTKRFRASARPVRDAVKAAWLAAPSKGHASSTKTRQAAPDLRWLLARSTHTEVRLGQRRVAGVAVRTDGRKMPDHQKTLPHYAEGTRPRWRHPVFGNRNHWVDQNAFPRFYTTVAPLAAKAHKDALDAVNDILEKIAHAR